ncbi:MAG: cytochrome C [Candidatus Kapaibacterium sp.]
MKIVLQILKWLGIVLGAFAVILVIYIFAQRHRTFDAPYPNIKASTDSAVIARGKYLAFGPAHCGGCHCGMADTAKMFRGEIVDLKGGREFILPFGIVRARNITSDKETGIGRFTDAEIARTLRYGVGSDGRAIFDFMNFYDASDEDLTAIISYLRSTTPVNNKVANHEFNFIGDGIRAIFIKPMGSLTGTRPVSTVSDTTAKYGEYLANSVANCRGCHTNRDMATGAYVNEYYSGGFMMPSETDPKVTYVTRNLTPDKETGHLVNWNFEQFYNRIHTGPQTDGSSMPWVMYKHMSENDIKAIWNYLHTLKPVKNDVGPVRIVAQK